MARIFGGAPFRTLKQSPPDQPAHKSCYTLTLERQVACRTPHDITHHNTTTHQSTTIGAQQFLSNATTKRNKFSLGQCNIHNGARQHTWSDIETGSAVTSLNFRFHRNAKTNHSIKPNIDKRVCSHSPKTSDSH